uniref:Uncharacterized protein n=1 Tax=Marseillevirus sp. TaxID=2809551 RepID=A0AA96EMJ9_9VIRU|nr:hypothetical protein MarDSR_191 [Marseillevirus sp.]
MSWSNAVAMKLLESVSFEYTENNERYKRDAKIVRISPQEVHIVSSEPVKVSAKEEKFYSQTERKQ